MGLSVSWGSGGDECQMLILTSKPCRGLSRTWAWSHTETQSNGRGQFWQQDSEKWQEAREHEGRAKNSWKIPNAEAGEFAGPVSQLCPAATSWIPLNLSFPFANLLGIARTHFGSLTQVFCGPLDNWYAPYPRLAAQSLACIEVKVWERMRTVLVGCLAL